MHLSLVRSRPTNAVRKPVRRAVGGRYSAAVGRHTVLWAWALALLFGCARNSTEVEPLTTLLQSSRKAPVVMVPGVTGTKLGEQDSKRVQWGSARSLILPRDGGYGVALPLQADARPLKLLGPVLGIRFLLWRGEAYGSILRLMEANGYRQGRLEEPTPQDDFFFFNYDWRQDSVTAAQRLAGQLEELARVRGDEETGVSLICQSNAARLCRYLVKYGKADLEEAKAGRSRALQRVYVDKLMLVGTSNGGALRVLREMNRGRTYIRLIGRRWLPETLFTLRSLYEDLPIYRRDLFFDAAGKTIGADLWDIESWKRYGWSVYAPEVAERLQRTRRPDLFGDPQHREGFLRQVLNEAESLHRVLMHDTPPPRPTRYYLLENLGLETPERALLVQEGGLWGTYFADDRQVRRAPELHALAVAEGDGHATVESQNWLPPQERAALAHPPVAIHGGHFQAILSPGTQRYILRFLAE